MVAKRARRADASTLADRRWSSAVGQRLGPKTA